MEVVFTYLQANWIELLGSVLSIIYLYLSIKQKASLWIFGFLCSALYVVVFFQSKEGLMLLGPAGISVGRAPLMYVLLCYLESRHGMKVDTPIFTKAGKLFSVSQDGTKYMLKKWVSGRECEVRRERDVLEAAQALGLLHQRMDWGEILGDGAWTKEKMQEMIPHLYHFFGTCQIWFRRRSQRKNRKAHQV
jgi:hypothetical protein